MKKRKNVIEKRARWQRGKERRKKEGRKRKRVKK